MLDAGTFDRLDLKRWGELASDLTYVVHLPANGPFEIEWIAGSFSQVTGAALEALKTWDDWMGLVHPDDVGRAEACVPSILSGERQECELRVVTTRGDVRWLNVVAQPVWDVQRKRVERVFGVVRDISERKRIEEENKRLRGELAERRRVEKTLRETAEQFKNLFENSPLGIYRTTPDGRILLANPALVRMLGFASFDELAERNLESAGFEPDYPRSVFKQRIEKEGQIVGLEAAWKKKDGSVLFVRENARAIREGAEVLFYEGTVEDISAQKQMEQELRRRNEGLMALNAVSAAAVSSPDLGVILKQILVRVCHALDATEGSILLKDTDSERLFFAVSLTDKTANLRGLYVPMGKGIAGWVAEHGEPVRVNDVHGDARWSPEVDMSTGFETRSLICAPLIHREGVTGVIELVNKHDGDFTAEDLSLLIAVAAIAAAAIENARLYAASQVRVRELVTLYEMGLVLTATLDYEQLVKAALFQVQRLFNADKVALLRPDTPTGGSCFVQTLEGERLRDMTVRLTPGEGIAGWVLENGQAVLTEDARQDPRFSDQVDRLLAAEPRAMMAVPLLAAERAIGVLQVIGSGVAIYAADSLRALQSIASVLAVALENARLYAEQKRLLREREETQTQLIQVEKMAALGRLMASIAHEINNPLQAIQGCMTLVEEELSGERREDKLTRYLSVVGSEIERIAEIMKRMRDFCRPAQAQHQPVDLHQVLESVLTLAQKQLQHNHVQTEREWSADLPLVQANANHLKQVFLNIVLNAIDAMPQGGTLRITTARDWLHGQDEKGIPAVRVSFSDTGVGLSDEAQTRLFEPFFTTKADGTGLGLSISYQIIQAHRGRFLVESQEGVGSTFTILLPA